MAEGERNGGGGLPGWDESPTFRHTFSTGRSAVVRRVINLYTVARHSIIGPEVWRLFEKHDKGLKLTPIEGLEMLEAVVATLWVEPQVMVPEDEREREPGVRIRFDDLAQQEIDETWGLWEEVWQRAARFRGEPAGGPGGADGAGVVEPAEPAARAAGGKPRGVRGRPAAGRARA